MLEELSQSIELSPLNQEKILRMLRMPRQADAGPQDPVFDAQLAKQVGLCEAEVRRCAHPRAVLRILPVGELGPLLEGNDIQRLLADCEEAVLMAVTLGAELEKRLMQEVSPTAGLRDPPRSLSGHSSGTLAPPLSE